MNWLKTLIGRQNQAVLKIIFFSLLVLIVGLACINPVSILWQERQEREITPPVLVQRTVDIEPAEEPTITPGSALVSTPTPTTGSILASTSTITPTPTPWVNISGNTNCRYGPGVVYDLIYTYLAGDQALLLGKDAGENYWYIQDPEQDDLYCWMWGKYATPMGDTASLPVFTPPPTPTPSLSFSIAYQGSDCGAGSCWLWFSITNTGRIPLESVKTYAKNTVTGDQATNKANVFKTAVSGSDISKAVPGATVYTHSEQLPNPSGNKVNVTITVCSLDGQSGICLSKSLSVTP